MRSVAVALLLIGSILLAGCSDKGSPSNTLQVIAAGSLLAPFAEAEQEFEASHPGVDVRIEGHGSIQVIRQVTDEVRYSRSGDKNVLTLIMKKTS